jgi:hypothetical protein
MNLELRSKITSDGLLELFLEETPVPEPAAAEIVIRIEAAAQSVSVRSEAAGWQRRSWPPWKRC